MDQTVTAAKPALYQPSEAAIAHLCGAVQCATVSAEDEAQVNWQEFEKLHAFLETSYPLIHKTMEREVVARGSLLYRWKGRGQGKPYALLAHMDVVSIDHPEHWTVEPFCGTYDGTYVWGRGAADMKCQLIAILETIEQLIAEGFTPNQDVYLCFGHNEEVMAPHSGAKAMAELLKSRGVELEFVADEAGAIMMEPPFGIQKPVAMVGMAEKGFANLELTIRGEGGHSAEPEGLSALELASQFIVALGQNPMPYRLIPTVEAYVQALAGAMAPEERERIERDPDYVFEKMAEDKKCHAMVRTTIVPTVMRSGQIFNAIPSEAKLVLNSRILPGDTAETVSAHIKAVLSQCGIADYTLEVAKYAPPAPVTPNDAPTFQILKKLYLAWYPDFIVTPYLVTGGTDSKNYAGVTGEIYRISASLSYRGVSSGAHGDNERAPVVTLESIRRLFYGFIRAQSARYDGL